jgi:hypothetical protein
MTEKLKAIYESVKQYAVVGAAVLLAILYALFKRRGQEIAHLESTIAVTKTETELNALTKESENAHNETVKMLNDYVALKLNNDELVKKLGIGTLPGNDK